MSTFDLQPTGFYRNQKDFDIYAANGGDKVVVTTKRNSDITIHCKTLMDDHSNGKAEFHIEGMDIDNWTCDYARIGWNWNKCGGFIMMCNDMHPVAIRSSYRFGIAQNGLEAMCEDVIQDMLTEVLQAMKNYKSSEDYLRATYGK